MIRTRDFFLFFVAALFLLIAIGSTLLSGLVSFNKSDGPVTFNDDKEVEYSVNNTDELAKTREGRLSELRRKIASAKLYISNEPVYEDILDTAEEKDEEILTAENRCAGYRVFAGQWQPGGLVIEEAEGARIVYRSEVSAVGTSTATTQKKVILQLPVRSIPSAKSSCITSDVIGITVGGALIRNSDVNTYRVFGSDTLIGYALDGFPIYGSSPSDLDSCGGKLTGAQYRYHVSGDRAVILYCFSGVPAAI